MGGTSRRVQNKWRILTLTLSTHFNESKLARFTLRFRYKGLLYD